MRAFFNLVLINIHIINIIKITGGARRSPIRKSSNVWENIKMRKKRRWLTALSLLLVRKACIVSVLLVSLLLATSCTPQPRSLEELTPYFSAQYSLVSLGSTVEEMWDTVPQVFVARILEKSQQTYITIPSTRVKFEIISVYKGDLQPGDQVYTMEGGIPITMEEVYLLNNNDQDRVNALDYYPLCFTPVGTVGLFFATDIEVPADAQPDIDQVLPGRVNYSVRAYQGMFGLDEENRFYPLELQGFQAFSMTAAHGDFFNRFDTLADFEAWVASRKDG